MQALPHLRILLVEDDPLQSAKTRSFLESLGQTVLLAADAAQAVALFDSERPDIVLMDVMLPGMNGFEATRKIRALCADRWIPIVYLTILGTPNDLVDGLEAGGDDYLVKPVECEILEAKLRSVIRTLRLYRALEESRDELARANAALQSANRELEAFTYAAAHDLKAPLRAINGYSNLLVASEGARLTDEGRDYVCKIIGGTEAMGQLIDDLLEYSKLERGPVVIERIQVDSRAEAMLREFDDEIRRLGAQCSIAASCKEIFADRGALTLILRNLVGNALKFAAGARPPVIEVGCRTEKGKHLLWVRDNGIGFDMRHSERIFEIFQRLHRQEDYPGTGIGLAIVRKAAERMGGRCWAESTAGSGASFFVEWPAGESAHCTA